MLQFSQNQQVGRCAFADRYQFRLELDWRVVAGPPDFDRMMSDYMARLTELGIKNVRRSNRGSWRGMEGEGKDGLSTRFGRYFAREACLVELVFLWREGRDPALERDVLESVAEEPQHCGGAKRWRAFGMDLLASPRVALMNCTVEPAHARMVFADKDGRREECFSRRGMVGEWLRDTVRDWLRKSTPKKVAVSDSGSRHVGGHCVEMISGEIRARGLPGMLGRRTRYGSSAWICPGDGRLYTVSTRRCIGDDGAGGGLTCCPEMEKAGTLL